MGIRSMMWNVLARGEAPVLDPDEIVELAVVSPFAGPMTVAALERVGIEAALYEVPRYPAGTSLQSSASVRVRRRDLEQAREVQRSMRT